MKTEHKIKKEQAFESGKRILDEANLLDLSILRSLEAEAQESTSTVTTCSPHSCWRPKVAEEVAHTAR